MPLLSIVFFCCGKGLKNYISVGRVVPVVHQCANLNFSSLLLFEAERKLRAILLLHIFQEPYNVKYHFYE